MRLPDPSPVLDKNLAPMGPEILSSTGAGVWGKAPMAFPDSSSVLDKFLSARTTSALSKTGRLLSVGHTPSAAGTFQRRALYGPMPV